jgi:RNA polymerase sigma-70 factor (ECF subfamily)
MRYRRRAFGLRALPELPRESFEAAILPQFDAVHNLARWLMRDANAAEDVLQEAMLRALTYFPSFRGGNPRAWLLQIVRNMAYDALKLDRAAQFVPLAGSSEDDDIAGVDLPSGEDDPETSLIKSRDLRRLQELIGGLPIELRETLVLRELEELSYKEIAEVTQVPIGTVMSRLWRARRALLQAAADQERSQ